MLSLLSDMSFELAEYEFLMNIENFQNAGPDSE